MLKFDNDWRFNINDASHPWQHCGRVPFKWWCPDCQTAVPKLFLQKVLLLGFNYKEKSIDELIKMFNSRNIKHDYDI